MIWEFEYNSENLSMGRQKVTLLFFFFFPYIDGPHKAHGEKSSSKERQNPCMTFPRHLLAKDLDISMRFAVISCMVNNRVKRLSIWSLFKERVIDQETNRQQNAEGELFSMIRHTLFNNVH